MPDNPYGFRAYGLNPANSYREAVKDAERKAARHFKDMEQTKASEDYAQSAFTGGDRTRFEDEKSLHRYYGDVYITQQKNVKDIRDALVAKIEEQTANHLKLDTDDITQAQAALSVVNSDDVLRRWLADPAHREYSHFLAVASFAKEHKDYPTAVAVATRFNQFEDACAIVKKRAAGVLVNDRYSSGAWESWVETRISEVDDAYNALMKAVDGERVTAWESLSAGV